MGARLHGCVLVRHRGRQAHIRVCSSPGRSETSGWRDRPQLKLRVPELPTHPEKRVLSTLQGEVADKSPTATITAQVQSIQSLHNVGAP